MSSDEDYSDDDIAAVSRASGRSRTGSRQSGSSRTGKSSRRADIMFSDSDEEDELDQRGLSPQTMMSITGVYPNAMSDVSSEIDYSSGDDAVPANPVQWDNDQDNEEHTLEEDVDREELAAQRYLQAANADADQPRYSTNFATNIEDTLHSTLFADARSSPRNDSSGSDVLVLSNHETPLVISSSSTDIDDDSFNKNNNKENRTRRKSPSYYSPRHSADAPVPKVKTTKPLVQPTILGAIKKTADRAPPQRRSVKMESVSQEFYDKEAVKLAELRTQMKEALKLYDNMSHKLPDKGIQIRKRIERLQQDMAIKEKYLQGLKVQNGLPKIKVTGPRSSNSRKAAADKNDVPDWDQLSAGLNRIQPTHRGAQSLAAFNAKKALTIDALKNLHSSLKGCPGPNVLADDPAGLTVKLMDHQKHALAWMTWREKQHPRGGVLADDMGLGKTLTMIALVLMGKSKKKSDSDDDTKGRKNDFNGGTLVVCPASLLRQWEGEVNSKLSKQRLSVCVHHGSNRETKAKNLSAFDIVVTTYNLVQRDDKNGPLNGVKWQRVILDEAHVVRNYKAQSSVAVTELHSKFRWALTGTPIHNKELDVYALLKFLRCSPFDDLNTWNTWIDQKSGGGHERLNLLMKTLMLRRTKAQLQLDGKLNSLPKKETRLIEMSLDTDEMNVYQRVMTYSQTLFAQFLFQRAEKDSDANFLGEARKPTYRQIKDPNGAYFKIHQKFAQMAAQPKTVQSHEILVLLLRLRQICCHPGLIDAMLDGEDSGEGIYKKDSMPEIDLLAQLKKLNINDSGSSRRSSSGGRKSGGGGDEARLAKAAQYVLKRSNPVFNLKRPSSKMIKVLEILKKNVLKSKEKDKAIIVSQWTSVLDILRDILHKEKLETLSLNGGIPVKDRQNIVNQFNDPNNSKRILLLSLTAGGVGLNLVGANHLLLLDLHWNPQLEAQAQDRIYRVGQKKNVIIYKFICIDTVEQRIKALQDRKLELADGVLTGGKLGSKLSIDDLKGLFGM